MAQQIINVGASPNDGAGDPVRTAFIKTNANFSELFNQSQISPPPTLVGSPGDTAGMTAYNSSYWYYCYADYDGSSIIWAQVAQVGNVTLPQILNGTSNINISSANANAVVSIANVSNVALFTSGGFIVNGYANIHGTVTASSVVATSNVSVAGNVTSGNVNTSAISASGNVTGGNVSISGTISATANVTGGNVVSLGTVSSAGNINGTNINGSQVYSAANISAAGNITGTYLFGNGVYLTGVSGGGGTAITNGLSTVNIPVSGGNVDVSVGVEGQVATFSIDGLYIQGSLFTTVDANVVDLNASANVNAADHITANEAVITHTVSAGAISASGNVTGQYIIGDGSQLTGLPANYGNTQVAAYLPTYNGNLVSLQGNVNTTANISASYFIGNGSQLTGIQAGTNYTNANVAAYLPTYTGNLAGGNANITSNLSVGSTITTNHITGQLTGTVNNLNLSFGVWDFGNIDGVTFSTPVAWIFSQTAAGNIDMGTIASPSSYNIDIGTIY